MRHVPPTLGTRLHPRTLGKHLRKAAADNSGMVTRENGVVVSVQAGPPRSLTINVGRDPTPIPGVRWATSYGAVDPVAGDQVAVDYVGRLPVVVWKLAQ